MFKINDIVDINYKGEVKTGIVHSVYNNGETCNILELPELLIRPWPVCLLSHHISYMIRDKNKLVIRI